MTRVDRTSDAYLDRRMTAPERARFEFRLLREPRLAAAVELSRDIESSVRRTLAAPDLSGLVARIEAAALQMRSGGVVGIEGSIRWIAAATALLVLCVVMCAASVMAPKRVDPDQPAAGEDCRTLTDAVGLGIATTASALALRGAASRRAEARRRVQRHAGVSVGSPAHPLRERVPPRAPVAPAARCRAEFPHHRDPAATTAGTRVLGISAAASPRASSAREGRPAIACGIRREPREPRREPQHLVASPQDASGRAADVACRCGGTAPARVRAA